jgi:uncharacterized repeat protein (TIGR01451 family)
MSVLRRFPQRRARQLVGPLARALLALFVMLGAVPPTPGPLAQALPPLLAPASVQAQAAATNVGAAVPCLGAAPLATTGTGDTIFQPPRYPDGSSALGDPQHAPALYLFSTTAETPTLALERVGATYGLAYDDGAASGQRRLFIGAFAQRFAAFGPAGAGGIYEYNLATGQVTTFAQLNNVNRHGSRTNYDREIGPWVGKSGLGDMEISPDGRSLYAMNLHTREIEVLPIAGSGAPSRIALSWGIISGDAGVQADLRPFGLGFGPDGRLDVGVVDSAERAGAVTPRAYVVSINPARPDDQFVALQVDLAQPAIANRFANSSSWKGIAAWHKWAFDAAKWGNPVRRPQPILSDITFAPDGSRMLLGFRDRSGDQFWSMNPPSEDNHVVVAQGDTLVYARQGGTWQLQTSATDVVASDFFNDNYIGAQNPPNHSENHGGVFAVLPKPNGQVDVATTSITPQQGSTGGVTWYSLDPAARERVASNEIISRLDHARGKAQRLGDLESLCTSATIGDYVWRDSDRDGQQDQGESGIGSVLLELLDGGNVATTATTDASGRYQFLVRPGVPYVVRVAGTNPALNGLIPTGSDQGGNDASDSDLDPATRTIAVPPQPRGAYTMSFDAGFVEPAAPPPTPCVPGAPGCFPPRGPAEVGDLVWNDLDANGVQDQGEPGIPGVTVELISAATSETFLSVTTSITGYYSFREIPAIDTPDYRIRVTTPQGFSRCPRDVGGNDAQDSDGDSTGTTPAFAAPADSYNWTLDFGFYRATNVRVDKSGPATAQREETFTYLITTTNTTQQPALDVRMADTLPAGVSFVSAEPPLDGITSGTDTTGAETVVLHWQLGQLDGGASRVVRVTVRVKPGATNVQRNVARVSTPSFGDDPADNSSTWDTVIPATETDIEISKDGPAEAARGELITYTLGYRNNGPDPAHNVQIDDVFPPNFEFVSASPAPASASDTNARWYHAGNATNLLAAGASGAITVVGRITAAGTATNTAEIRTTTRETTLVNNRDQAVTIVTGPPQANLAIVKRGPNTAQPGGSMGYYLYLRETTGNRPAESVIVTDTLPPGVSFVSAALRSLHPAMRGVARPERFVVRQQGQQLVIELGAVPANYSDRIDITLAAPASAGEILNTVRIDTTTEETSSSDNTSEWPTLIRVTPPDSIGDRVFLDRDGNGLRDFANEPGIGGAQLDLYRYGQPWYSGDTQACSVGATSTFVRSTTTDPSGSYVFEQAVPPTSTLGGDLVVVPAANFAPGGPLAGLALTPFTTTFSLDAQYAVIAAVSPDGTCTGASASIRNSYRRAGQPAGTIILPGLAPKPYDPGGFDAPQQRERADVALRERWNVTTTKSGPAAALAGDVFSYTLAISHTRGFETAQAVLSDTLPAGLVFVGASPAPSRVAGQTLEWGVTLTPGTGQSVSVQVRAPSNAPAQVVENRACASVTAGEYDEADNCTPPVPTEIVPLADLVVDKVGPATAVAGDILTYTLAYRNAGQAPAAGVVVSDTLPAGLSFVNASVLPSSISGQSLVWSVGDLGIGEAGLITLSVRSETSLANFASRTNTLRATTSTPEPKETPGPGGAGGSPNQDSVTTLFQNADVRIDKQGPATGIAGASWTYLLVYRNAGPATARDVELFDTLPAGLTATSASPGAQIIGNSIRWTLGELASNATGQLTVTVQSDSSLAPSSVLTNTAEITTSTPDRDLANNQDSVATTLSAQWDAPVSKTAKVERADGKLTPGALVRYTLAVTSSGPSLAPSVVVSDVFPSDSLIFVEAQPTPTSISNDGRFITWVMGAMRPGASAEIHVTARVRSELALPDGSAIVNRAGSNGPGREPASEGACLAPVCVSSPFFRPDLAVTKDDGLTTATPGQQLSYQIRAANVGQLEATGVVLVETIPAGTTLVAAASPGWEATPEAGIYRFVIGDMAAGAVRSVPLVVQVQVPFAATSITNRVSISDDGSRGPDQNPANNTGEDSDAVPTACLGDMVWDDLNANGLQDAGEGGIDQVLLELLDDAGTVITTTRTTGGGRYAFCGLGIGVDYRVRVEATNFAAGGPLEKQTITRRDAGDDARDSDASPATRTTGTIRLTPTGDTSIDIGVVPSVETTDIALATLPSAAQGEGNQLYLPLFLR